MTDEDEDLMDFSEEKPKPFGFTLDGDRFEAYGAIPAGVVLDVTDMKFLEGVASMKVEVGTNISAEDAAKLTDANRQLFQRYAQFLDTVLMPESRTRFAERMKSLDNPITMPQLQRIYHGLMKKYGEGRPTGPSSPSSNGHGGTDTNSTDEVSIGDLTRSDSPPTDS